MSAVTIKDEIIRTSLKTAKDWDARGNPNWASHSYSDALLAMLSKAVTTCTDGNEGIQCLVSSGGRDCLGNVCRCFRELRGEIVAGRLPWAVIGGNYHLIVFSHVGTLIGEGDAAAEFLELANEPEVVRLATKFWGAYGQALLRVSQRKEVEVPQLKLRRGLEQYWIKYLDLMKVLVRGEITADCLRDLGAAFDARNRDPKIKDDQYEVEGSALHSVTWDFRKDAILGAAK